jgi:hypothetical protein
VAFPAKKGPKEEEEQEGECSRAWADKPPRLRQGDEEAKFKEVVRFLQTPRTLEGFD